MVQNSPHLCLCYTSLPGNSVRTCTWASLHCCRNIISKQSLFTFCIRSWEGTHLHQSSVCILTCSVMWNSAKWISLLIFHHSTLTIFIAESVYEMHVSVFFICKHVRYFGYDHTATQHSHASLDSV
jgi:hypothetical protein